MGYLLSLTAYGWKNPLDTFINHTTLTHKGSLQPSTMGLDEKFTPLRKGLLEFLLLKIIAADKVYAADILRQLRATEFATQEGTLYPLLSKMRREGLLDYEWQESDSGPPRKYYRLTAKGKSQLSELNEFWKDINATINQLGR